MSGLVVFVLIACGLGVVLVRRRSVAIGLVSLQSIILGVGALTVAGDSGSLLAAGFALILKGILLPFVLAHTVRGARERRPVVERISAAMRLTLALALCLALAWSVGDLGLEPSHTGSGAVILLGLGLAIALLRQSTLFQALGFIVAENGAYLAALGLVATIPPLIEAGMVFDLLLIIAAAALFTTNIRERFGTSDSAGLSELSDR